MQTFIHNAENQKLSVLVEGLENQGNHKLVFIQPGLSSYKEYHTVRIAAEAFLKKGYVVVTFDSRYSFGQSDGDIEFATLSAAIEDLETVIDWAKAQDFYCEPFALSGHSLGGGSVLFYAEENPDDVNLLVPISAMVGGKYYLRSYMLNRPEFFEKWQTEGKRFCRKSNDKSVEGFVSFDFVTDLQNYDMVFEAGKIKAQTLLITGDEDLSSTLYNNQHLLAKIEGAPELVVLEHCGHTFESEQNQEDLSKIIEIWLENV